MLRTSSSRWLGACLESSTIGDLYIVKQSRPDMKCNYVLHNVNDTLAWFATLLIKPQLLVYTL